MKLKCSFIILFFLSFSFRCFSENDSLNAYTGAEIIKLSNLIYELEKRDSLASATEPDGFQLKDASNIHEDVLLVDLKNNDSIYYYTGTEVIKLSNYIYELEKRDSIRRVNDSLKALKRVVEYHMEEESDIKNFESVVFFSFNSSSITPESYRALDEILKILKSYLNLTFMVEGYTDNAGSASYNKVLSIRRAKALKEYFINKGISASRIVSVAGYGGAKYMYPNDTEEGRAKNRSVIIKAYH